MSKIQFIFISIFVLIALLVAYKTCGNVGNCMRSVKENISIGHKQMIDAIIQCNNVCREDSGAKVNYVGYGFNNVEEYCSVLCFNVLKEVCASEFMKRFGR